MFKGDIIMYIKRLRELREDNDKFQKDIAILLQITSQQYQLYESGKRDLPIELLKILAVFYNVSTDYILELTDNQKPYERK